MTANKKSRSPRKNARPPKSGRSVPRDKRWPRVLVIGEHGAARNMRTAIRRGGLSCDHIADHNEALAAFGVDGSKAIVIAPPLRAISVARFRSLVPADVTMMVALSESAADAQLRKLYKAGAAAVFAWPTERRALVESLIRVVKGDPQGPDRARRAADVALEEKAKAALDACGAAEDKLDVVVVHGNATAFGFVDALWKVYAAEQAIEHVPRIRNVDLKGVVVVGSPRTDRSIEKAVRTLLKETSDVDASTIAITVHDGRVTLSGSAESRRELKRLQSLVRHVRGVRAVRRLVVVSEDAKSEDRAAAEKVVRAMSTRGAERRVRVAVFGGVCVLSGTATTAGQRRTLEELAQIQPGVRRVVNKLTTDDRRA